MLHNNLSNNNYFTKLSHGVVPKQEAMKYEALRMSTFKNFPSSTAVSSIQLSQVGFFYSGTGDEVECYSCGLKLKDWSPTDNPNNVHRKYSPNCPFMCNNVMDNIPMASKCPQYFSDSPFSTKKLIDPPKALNSLENQSPFHYAQASVPNRSLPPVADSIVTETTSQNRETKHEQDARKEPIHRSMGDLLSATPNSDTMVTRINTPNISSEASSQQQIPNNTPTLNPEPRRHQDYRFERDRLESFSNWPSNAAVNPEDLARSGFYYTGMDDRVQCTFCRGILRNWEPGDQPEAEHRRHFGQCPLLNNPIGVGNVKISEECGGTEQSNKNDIYQQNYCKGIVTENAVHHQYARLADRLATFKDFPTNITQTPQQFTKAGFFYSGLTDSVKCFFCDGGLRNWEPNDDPWMEHARWFPRCGYLRLCKGDEFIKEIQDKFTSPTQKPPRIRHTIKTKKYPVDKDKVTKYMKERITLLVLDMGYEVEKVKQVIIKRMEELGDSFFPNSESLVDAILEYDEEVKYREVQGENSNENSSDDHADTTANNQNNEGIVTEEEKPDKKKSKKKKRKKKNKSNDPLNVIGNVTPLQYLDADEAKTLEADVERMKDERLCKVCMDEEVNIVFLRCGHLVCCSNCATALRHCPICREQIKGTVRVFLS